MSLVEVLLYISISTVIMISLSYFMFTVTKSRVKSQTITEVEYQGNQVIYLIMEAIRNSQSITSPLEGTSSENISLQMENELINPTLFSLTDGKMFIQEGSSESIQISSSKVDVISLQLDNITGDSLTQIIKITLTVTHKNPENVMEYNFTETFTGSASLRDDYE